MPWFWISFPATYNMTHFKTAGLEVPKTSAELEAALEQAKAAGETPLMMGNSDGTMALHTYFNVSDQPAQHVGAAYVGSGHHPSA